MGQIATIGDLPSNDGAATTGKQADDDAAFSWIATGSQDAAGY
jgi:hypothetical protein